MDELKAVNIYNAIKEMEVRDYSETEIINGIERLLRHQPLVII